MVLFLVAHLDPAAIESVADHRIDLAVMTLWAPESPWRGSN